MKKVLLLTSFLMLVALILTACSGVSNPSNNNTQVSHIFMAGEDAPVPSVVAFNITINSITLNSSSASVNLLTQPETVDFGRLVGLRSLLGFNSVTPGTYTSATFTFANPVINYVDITTAPPSIGTLKGTLSTSTVTVQFPASAPLVVANNGLAGLHMDFDLHNSLAVDGNGQMTGVVNPQLTIGAVSASDALGQITEFTGSLVSVASSGTTFTMQGPYGFQEVIDTNSQTLFSGSYTTSSLPPNSILSVEGSVQADGSILASAVEVVTTNQAFISGRILAVNPGPVVTMFVGEELPNLAPSIPVDSVYTVNLSAIPNTAYDVCFFNNWFTQQLFDGTSLVVGQRILVGGIFQSGLFTPGMVSLRRQGVIGSLVANSVSITSGNQGSFQMLNDLLMSYSAGGPFSVDTGNGTIFFNTTGLSALKTAGTPNMLARGLVFKDMTTSKPVVWAHLVAQLP